MTKPERQTILSSFLALFLLALCYSSLLLLNQKSWEIAGTVFFVALSTATYVWLFLRLKGTEPPTTMQIAIVGIAVPLGLVIPATLGGRAEDFFWVSDSVNTHIPRAMEIVDWIAGRKSFPNNWQYFSQGFLTHFLTGVFISVFGRHAWVTVMVLAFLRIGTALLLVQTARRVFRSEKFSSVFIFYFAAPNVLFHTTTLYKEATIHFLVAAIMLCVVSSVKRPTALKGICFVALVAALFLERFYLVILMVPASVALFYAAFRSRNMVLILTLAIAITIIFLIHPYSGYSISYAIERIKELRYVHSQFPDVDFKYNYEIPYVIAVVKTLLTPIWTPNKIAMFGQFSALVTWGTLVNHALILGYCAGVYHAIRKLGWRHLAIQIPFFCLVLLIAYISPWAGRVRDSFAPLIGLYACFFYVECLPDTWRRFRIKLRSEKSNASKSEHTTV